MYVTRRFHVASKQIRSIAQFLKRPAIHLLSNAFPKQKRRCRREATKCLWQRFRRLVHPAGAYYVLERQLLVKRRARRQGEQLVGAGVALHVLQSVRFRDARAAERRGARAGDGGGVAPVGGTGSNDGPQPDGGERQLLRRRDQQAARRADYSARRGETAAHSARDVRQLVGRRQVRLANVEQTGLREARRAQRRKQRRGASGGVRYDHTVQERPAIRERSRVPPTAGHSAILRRHEDSCTKPQRDQRSAPEPRERQREHLQGIQLVHEQNRSSLQIVSLHV